MLKIVWPSGKGTSQQEIQAALGNSAVESISLKLIGRGCRVSRREVTKRVPDLKGPCRVEAPQCTCIASTYIYIYIYMHLRV